MSADGEAPKKVGYRNPPSEHQFRPGTSGNPKGRPLKDERSLTPRQLRRDVIKVAEAKTRIRTPRGEKEVAIIEAVWMVAIKKALGGHGPSIRWVISKYERSVGEHYETHEDHFKFVEMVERDDVISPVTPENAKHQKSFINHLRKRTQRI